MRPHISIIIPTKNAGKLFKYTLDMICRQCIDKDFEIIIIDSGSTDNTLKIASEYTDKIYRIGPEDFHHARTRNLGALYAKGEILVFMVQDAVPLNTSWLYNLTLPLYRCGNVVAVYGRQIPYGSHPQYIRELHAKLYPKASTILRPVEKVYKIFLLYPYTSSCNFASRRGFFIKHPFNNLINFAEDKEWAYRIMRISSLENKEYVIVYNSKAAVVHSHNFSLLNLMWRRSNDGCALRKIEEIHEGGMLHLFKLGGLIRTYNCSSISSLFKQVKLKSTPIIIIQLIGFLYGYLLGKNL